MSARQSPCFTCLKGVAKLIKFRQNGHISMLFFHFGATEAGCQGLTARHGTGGNGKRKSLLAAHFHSDMHDKEALSDRNVRMQPSHIPFLLLYFFTFLPFKIVNTCGRVPTSGAASWVSTRGNGSLCSSRFLPRRSRRTSPIALPCCRRLRGRCPELPALPL